MVRQPFTMVVDWPEIGCLMEVSYYVWYMHILCIYFVRQNYSSVAVHVRIRVYVCECSLISVPVPIWWDVKVHHSRHLEVCSMGWTNPDLKQEEGKNEKVNGFENRPFVFQETKFCLPVESFELTFAELFLTPDCNLGRFKKTCSIWQKADVVNQIFAIWLFTKENKSLQNKHANQVTFRFRKSIFCRPCS